MGISPSQSMWAQILQIGLVLGTLKAWDSSMCCSFPRHTQMSSVMCCPLVQVLHVLHWGQAVKCCLSDLPLSFQRTSLSALERSEQQIRRASSLEELLHITHSEDWKLWKCRLKLKSLANLDSRSASHRSTRFAAAFYDIDTLKGRCRFVAKSELSFKAPP